LTIDSNEFLEDYLFKKYFALIVNKSEKQYYDLIDMICDRLRYKNKPSWYEFVKKIIKQTPKNNFWYMNLAEILGLESKIADPFDNFDVDKITEEDLPF